MYSHARAAITYSHPYITTRTLVHPLHQRRRARLRSARGTRTSARFETRYHSSCVREKITTRTGQDNDIISGGSGPARFHTGFHAPLSNSRRHNTSEKLSKTSRIVENSPRARTLAMRTGPDQRPGTLKGSPYPFFLPQIQACTHTVLRRWTTVCALGHRQLHAGSHTTRESSVSPALPAARHRRHRRWPAPGRAHGPAIGPPPHKPSPSAPPPAQQLLPPL